MHEVPICPCTRAVASAPCASVALKRYAGVSSRSLVTPHSMTSQCSCSSGVAQRRHPKATLHVTVPLAEDPCRLPPALSRVTGRLRLLRPQPHPTYGLQSLHSTFHRPSIAEPGALAEETTQHHRPRRRTRTPWQQTSPRTRTFPNRHELCPLHHSARLEHPSTAPVPLPRRLHAPRMTTRTISKANLPHLRLPNPKQSA